VLTNQVVTKMMGQFAYEDAVGGNIVSHGCHFRYRVKAKGFSYNESLVRYITVVDSVDLAPGTAEFYITDAGIADQEKVVYKIKDPSAYELKESERQALEAGEAPKPASPATPLPTRWPSPRPRGTPSRTARNCIVPRYSPRSSRSTPSRPRACPSTR
jgi:hypothetical protein